MMKRDRYSFYFEEKTVLPLVQLEDAVINKYNPFTRQPRVAN